MPSSLLSIRKLPDGLKFYLMLSLAAVTVPTVAMSEPHPAIAQEQAAIAQATNTRPTLRLGSDGNPVEELQALLTLLGYFQNPVDGNYQDTTETAVRAFQQDVGITSDGIVGPATWDKLLPPPSTDLTPPAIIADTTETTEIQSEDKDEPVALPTLRAGMHGPAVTRVQERLKALGFYAGALDGVFGPGTETAVMEFQESVQLVDDGVVGPATWGALLGQ
ncbi:MAG: peptidoglycan-binding protein [Cyanobacteria bacterium J06626_18]